jgi:phospholipid transport system transporter-binding protein
MSQQLSWSREGETLKLSGELDQDLLNPLWDKRHEAMQGVTLIDLTDVTRGYGRRCAACPSGCGGEKAGDSVTLRRER